MNVRHIIKNCLTAALAAASLTACSLMSEDLSDCPTGLYVNFVYDYNNEGPRGSDMFKDHVGGLTLYVYDEADRLVAQKTVSGPELTRYGYNIHFTEEELAPNHNYRLQALALQKDWSAAISTIGAKYRRTDLRLGDSRTNLAIKLDRIPASLSAGQYNEVLNAAPLDTLWHTLSTIITDAPDHPAATVHHEKNDGTVTADNGTETVRLEQGAPTYATVSLIRDTKHLNISINELEHPEDCSTENYEVFILDDNGDLDYANHVTAPSDSLIYRPYAQWNYTSEGDEALATRNSAHYDIMFNRLRYVSNKLDGNAMLCIRRRSDGGIIGLFNLPYILCEGRTSYEMNTYSQQEYLDREYDYRLHFFLLNGQWKYIYINFDVHTEAWVKRIVRVDLQ